MRNQILKKATVSIMLLLCINVSVAGTSTSVSCAEGGSASAYSRSGNSVSYSSVNCSSNNEQNAMTPAGIAVSKSYSPEPYTSLVLSGAFNTEIKTGGENRVTISGDSNYVESVEVNSSDGELIIRRPGPGNDNLNVIVESISLQKLKISGAGSTNIYGDFPDGLSVRKSGAGSINIEGQASTLKLNLSGAGNTTARDFTVDNVEIDATGAGNIAVCAKKSVAGSLAGAVHFKVYCNPSQRSVNTRGVSRVSYR
ncbi:MAG: hypothetical protein UZ02_AOB001001907 [Nitrosomonas europaea]|nr:MAG: hypothetical protein UZ02_AOB001001907 [Nitrosomonas europaea]